MKKTLALVAALVAVVTVVGCSDTKSTMTGSTSGSKATVTK